MKLLVCLKQILDPEVSPRDFQIDAARLEAKQGSASLVTNIFCENALETALQLREATGAEITALTFGGNDAEDSLRKALALRVEHAYRVDNAGEARGSAAAAIVLAAAIGKLGEFDIVLLGRESGDWGEGQTAGLLAERLGLPCVSFVDRIERPDDQIILHRQTDVGRESLVATSPVVVSVTNCDANVPRIPKTRDIMTAHRKELTTWTLDEVGLDAATVLQASSATDVVELRLPESNSQCEFIEGDSLEDRVQTLAERIADVLRTV